MSKQSRQNTLRVTAIQRSEEMTVDLDLICVHKKLRTKEAFRLILSNYLYESAAFDQEKKNALNLLYGKFLHHVNIGLQEIGQTQKFALEILVREINTGQRNLTSKAMLDLISDLIYRTPFEYFGKLGRTGFDFILKYRRRPERQHYQRYIGVGYSDKGAARDVSTQGNPTWAEVSSELKQVYEDHINRNSEILRDVKFSNARKFLTIDTGKKSNFGNPVRREFETFRNDELDITMYVNVVNIYFDESSFTEIETYTRSKSKSFVPLMWKGKRAFLDKKFSSLSVQTLKV